MSPRIPACRASSMCTILHHATLPPSLRLPPSLLPYGLLMYNYDCTEGTSEGGSAGSTSAPLLLLRSASGRGMTAAPAVPPMPAGHPATAAGADATTCPFALIQAALDASSNNTKPGGSSSPHAVAKAPHEKASAMLRNFQPSKLGDSAIPGESYSDFTPLLCCSSPPAPPPPHSSPPCSHAHLSSSCAEGISMKPNQLQEGLPSTQFSARNSPAAGQPQLMCPVSGEITKLGDNEGVKQDDPLARLKKIANSGKNAAQEDDAASHHGGGSKAGSKVSRPCLAMRTTSRRRPCLSPLRCTIPLPRAHTPPPPVAWSHPDTRK